jgi:hypothetical protein
MKNGPYFIKIRLKATFTLKVTWLTGAAMSPQNSAELFWVGNAFNAWQRTII